MNNYPTKKLGEVLELCDSGVWGDESKDGTPLLRSSNMQNGALVLNDLKYIAVPEEKIKRYTLHEGDILVTKSSGSVDHIGKSLYITKEMDGKYGFSNFTQRLRANKKQVLPKWIYYKISNPATRDFLLGASQTTTGLRNLKIPALKELEIPLPPLSEQKKIVAKLEKLLAKVNEAKKLRAEAQEVTSQLLPAELHKIFTEGKDKGWDENDLGEVCEIARGGSPRPIKDYLTTDEDGINWIKISDATQSTKYIYKTKQKIRKEGLHKTRLVKSGDFILTNSMSFGRPYIMRTEGAIHDGWLVLRPQGGLLEEYMYHFLSSDEIYYQFSQLAGGAVVQNLNSELVRSVKILIPPLPEQKKIVARLDSISEKAKQLKEYQKTTSNDLLALEQSILSKAFSSDFV